MTTLETLASQGRTRVHTGLAGINTAQLKQMRNQQLRQCFSQINEQKYRMEFIARIRGMEFYNDASSRNINATWFALKGMEGRLIWIVNATTESNVNYRRILPVASEKIDMMICVGENTDDLHLAFGGAVNKIVDASSIQEAVHIAYRSNMEDAKVVFSPATEDGISYEQEGEAFTCEVNEL